MKFNDIKKNKEMVKSIQRILYYTLYYNNTIDGIYGTNTRNGIRYLQNHLKKLLLYNNIIDGLLGREFFNSLKLGISNFESKKDEKIKTGVSESSESDPHTITDVINKNQKILEGNSFDKRIGKNVNEFIKKYNKTGVISGILDLIILNGNKEIYRKIFNKDFNYEDWKKLATNGNWEKQVQEVKILYDYIRTLPYTDFDKIGIPQDTFWMLGTKKEIVFNLRKEGRKIEKSKIRNEWTEDDLTKLRDKISKLNEMKDEERIKYFEGNFFMAKKFPHLAAVTQCVDSVIGMIALYAFENNLNFPIAKSKGFAIMSNYETFEEFLYDSFNELHSSYMEYGMGGIFKKIEIENMKPGDVIYMKHKGEGGHVLLASSNYLKEANSGYNISTFSGNKINVDWDGKEWKENIKEQYPLGFPNFANKSKYGGFGTQIYKYNYNNQEKESKEDHIKFWSLDIEKLNTLLNKRS